MLAVVVVVVVEVSVLVVFILVQVLGLAAFSTSDDLFSTSVGSKQ